MKLKNDLPEKKSKKLEDFRRYYRQREQLLFKSMLTGSKIKEEEIEKLYKTINH